MKPSQSPKRRFLTALLGGTADRVPVGNVVSVACVELMTQAGASFPAAHLDACAMATLAAAGHDLLGYDTVMPVFSVVQEAAALGCVVDWGSPGMMPVARTHPFSGQAELRLPEDWSAAHSIQVVLDSLALLRRTLGHRVAIVGKVMGPWSLSYHLLGIEEFLVSTLRDPGRARRSIDLLKHVTIAFARAQLQAGADVICLADHATGGMISPRMYREFLQPVHQEIVAEIGGPIVLHCCGNTTDRLDAFAETGIDCYHFESLVRVEDAAAAACGRMTLMGNINCPELLLRAEPSQVAAACRHAIRGGIQILTPECAVPLTTPLDNLKVLVDVAEGRA
jgi:[methyl-Co(III) methanol-specific corrinoid protein]:coenzyme M methyltransferase